MGWSRACVILGLCLLLGRHVVATDKACSTEQGQCPSEQPFNGDLTQLTATEAIDLLCQRTVTAVQYAEALLQRASEVECLNSYAALNTTKVLEEAAAIDAKAAAGEDIGPLCGLAFVVKDNIDVLGYKTVAGSPALEHFAPGSSSPLVKRLQAAHGVVLGKTRMHELAEGVTSISPHYGAVINPYQPGGRAFHVGGSSGGTAAIVAARGAPAGFCSDTGGSCRIPASLTGTVGFRPTTGCYKGGGGVVPETTTRDTVGVMARTVADVTLLDRVISSCPRTSPADGIIINGLRIGYPVNWWHDIGAEAAPAFDAALEALRGAGVEIVEFDIALLLAEGRAHAPDLFSYIYEMPRELSRYLYEHQYNLSLPELIRNIASPLVKQSLLEWSTRDLDSWPTPADYMYMLGTVTPRLTKMWLKYFDLFNFDVIVVPTTPITARPIEEAEPFSDINGRSELTLSVYTRTAEIDCPSAVPGLSIPIGLATDGLPIGIQIQTRPGDDALLLAVGEALEPLFIPTPPPERLPACAGCRGKTRVQVPAFSDPRESYEGVHLSSVSAKDHSIYSFELEGNCELKRMQA